MCSNLATLHMLIAVSIPACAVATCVFMSTFRIAQTLVKHQNWLNSKLFNINQLILVIILLMHKTSSSLNYDKKYYLQPCFLYTVLNDDCLYMSHNLYSLSEVYIYEFFCINMTTFFLNLKASYTRTIESQTVSKLQSPSCFEILVELLFGTFF